MFENNKSSMAAAEMRYDNNGNPMWNEMWSAFCGLAAEGGPPHRGISDRIKFSPNYKIIDQKKFDQVSKEISRGLIMLGAKNPMVNKKGEITIDLGNLTKAKWFAYAIRLENVEARNSGTNLILPFNENFKTDKEVKSIMTVWGKAKHYWYNHRNISVRLFILLFKYDPILKKPFK